MLLFLFLFAFSGKEIAVKGILGSSAIADLNWPHSGRLRFIEILSQSYQKQWFLVQGPKTSKSHPKPIKINGVMPMPRIIKILSQTS